MSSVLDIISEIIFWSTLATPVFSFLIVRKMEISLGGKILLGFVFTVVFAVLLSIISIAIIMKQGYMI